MRIKSRQRWVRLVSVIGVLVSTALLWQNCGNINLAANVIEVPLGSVSSPESQPTPFRLPESPDYNMRVAFLVDVSASMQTRGCPGTGADHDVGNCVNANVGADPYFNRLRMIENWIVQIDDYLAARGLPQDRLQMIFIPFSMAGAGDPLGPNGMTRINDRIDVYLNQKTFTSSRQTIRRIVDSYRKMYYSMLEQGPSSQRLDPAWGLETLQNKQDWQAAATTYIKTSIPAPSIDAMKTSVLNEINRIRTQTPNLISQTRFEVVFLSDGIAKPHHDDIRQSFELLWQARKIYRDYKWGHLYREYEHCSASGYSYCEFRTVDFSQAGQNCSANCRADIDFLIMNGRRSYTESSTCRQCVMSVLDYTSTPSNSDSGPSYTESFLNATIAQWGDHKLNYNYKIQMALRGLENVFLNNAEVQYRFNFVRFASDSPMNPVPPLLLTIERNWLEQAKVKFRGVHRHAVATTNRVPFALFPGQSEVNGYKLSHFFLINPHARINSVGIVTLDSDTDGLFDHEEDFLGEGYDKFNARTDGKCLDGVKFKSNSCIDTGCDAQIDLDGDGLNQCDENTLLTDDMDSDVDGDGISDYLEVVYGLNPNLNDSDEDNNGDGISNFVNFTLGAGPWTEVERIESVKKIQFRLKEAMPVPVNVGSQTALVPTYTFQLLSLPTIGNESAQGAGITYFNLAKRPEHENIPPVLARNYSQNVNRVLLMGRVDHSQNIGDNFWIFKTVDVPFSLSPIVMDIQINDLTVMPWLDFDAGARNETE